MKKLYFAGVLGGLLLSFVSHADQIFAQIEAVNENQTRVLVRSKKLQNIQENTLLNVGQNCTVEISKKTQDKAVLSSDLCANKSILKEGKTIQIATEQNQSTKSSKDSSESTGQGQTQIEFAQPESKTPLQITKGLQIGLTKASLDGNLKAKNRDLKFEVDHDFGLTLGYADIKMNTVGWMSNFIYTQFNSKANSIRFTGNGTYGISEHIYFLGGLNLHKFTSKSENKLDMGIGFQAGAGLQINKNLGLNLAYVSFNNSGDIRGVDVDLTTTGFEASIQGTF